MQDALYRAIIEGNETELRLGKTRLLDSSGHPIPAPEWQKKQYSDEYYINYHLHVFEKHMYTSLGEYLAENMTSISVLDVGSGIGMTPSALFQNIDSPISYTSIDFKYNPGEKLPEHVDQMRLGMGLNRSPQLLLDLISTKHIEHTHLSFHALEVTDDELKDKLTTKYDVIIIDIEPHGQEVKVYEKYRSFMKDEHICIVKHCLCREGHSSYNAEVFLDTYMKRGLIWDYHAQDEIYDRCDDMILIMRTQPITELVFFKCQSLTKGLFSNYVACAREGNKVTPIRRKPGYPLDIGYTERILELDPTQSRENMPERGTETDAQLDQ
jgi:hypothetical protein